jgi:hypothetical protein
LHSKSYVNEPPVQLNLRFENPPGFEDLARYVGQIISESPYVKLLAAPNFNYTHQRWEVLAQVNEALCTIQLRVRPMKGVIP